MSGQDRSQASSIVMIDCHSSQIEFKLQELEFEKGKYHALMEKSIQNTDILQREILHLNQCITESDQEIAMQIQIENILNAKIAVLRSISELRYTDLQSTLRDKERYEEELNNLNKSKEYRDIARRELKLIAEVLPQLEQQEECLQKLLQAREKQSTVQKERENHQLKLNEKSREINELKQLVSDTTMKLHELNTDIENLREKRKRIVSYSSFGLKKLSASEKDVTVQEYSDEPVDFAEHVRLVERQMPTKCLTVEHDSDCCYELIGLTLECNEQNIMNKENTVPKLLTLKRNINVLIGVLGVKLSENNDMQIITFRRSFDCISKILALKDKLIYLIIAHNLAESVVPLIHEHRCVEHIYVLKNIDDQKQIDWIKDYPNICTDKSSIESILDLITQDMKIITERPSHWLRSRKLFSQLFLQTDQINLWTLIEDTPKQDIRTTRIITLFFGSHPLFTKSQSAIQIDEFNDIEQCVRSIQGQNSTATFLIIPADQFDDVHSLLELDAIHAVYIIYTDNNNQQLEKRLEHSKVSGSFDLDKNLLEQLTADICFYRHMRFHTSKINIFELESSLVSNLDDQQIHFLLLQLFNDILPHIPIAESTETSDLSISFVIEANITINRLCDQFDSSTLQESIPLLKKINRCIISSWQLFDSSPITIYRAQLVSKNDLEKMQNNSNAFLSISNFVLASRSFRNIVNICRHAVDSQLITVLFKLNLSENVIRANLDADTVVISPKTVFRLTSIEYAVDGVWHVQLESVDGVMQQIKDQLQRKIGGPLTWLTFGNYLMYLQQFNAAEEYYQCLLNLLPGTHPGLVSIYNNSGLIYSVMDDNSKALNCLTKALSSNGTNSSEIVSKEISIMVDVPFSQDLINNPGPLLNKLADVSYRLGDQAKALELYQRAHDITIDVNLRNFYREKILSLGFVNNCQ